MKASTPLLSLTILLLVVSLSCSALAAPSTATLIPSPLPATNTPVPTAVPSQAAAEVATEVPGEAPIDLNAPYAENAVPQQDITIALAKSAKDGKLVLLDFGANWCPDCIVLTTLFEDPAVKPYLDENFHVVRIDVGMWDKNLDVAEQYGNPIANGIPAVVVLAPSGEIIASTKDGGLANARTATAQDILAFLQAWVALRP